MSKPLELVAKLIRLTNEDKLRWKRPLLNINSAEWRGWKFYTEMPQDDRSIIEIHSPDDQVIAVQNYGYGIEELNAVIDGQYQRLNLYEYGTDYQNELKRTAVERLAEQQRLANQLNDFTDQLKRINQETA